MALVMYPRSDRWNWGWDVSDGRGGGGIIGGDASTGIST